MSGAESKSETSHETLEAVASLAVEAAAALQRMSSLLKLSCNSSTPTPRPSPSASENGKGSLPTQPELGENLLWSSTFPNTASGSWSPSLIPESSDEALLTFVIEVVTSLDPEKIKKALNKELNLHYEKILVSNLYYNFAAQ